MWERKRDFGRGSGFALLMNAMNQTRNKSIAVIAALATAALTLTLAPSLAVSKARQDCDVKRPPSGWNNWCLKVRVVDSKSRAVNVRACNALGVAEDGTEIRTLKLCPSKNRLNLAKATFIDVRSNHELLALATWSGGEKILGESIGSSGRLWRIAVPLLRADDEYFPIYGYTDANGGSEFQVHYEVKFKRK